MVPRNGGLKSESEYVMEQEELIGLVYKLTSKTSGKGYVGQTRNYGIRKNGNLVKIGVQGRWKQHIWSAHNYRKNDCVALNRAIRRYGEDDFTVETLCTCPIEELNTNEEYYIAEHDTYLKGYNCTKGGDSVKMSPEHQAEVNARIAAKARARWANDEYREKVSAEISRVTRERMWDADVRANMLAALAPLRKAQNLPPNIYERKIKGVLVGYEAKIFKEGVAYRKWFSSKKKTVAENLALATDYINSLNFT